MKWQIHPQSRLKDGFGFLGFGEKYTEPPGVAGASPGDLNPRGDTPFMTPRG